MKITDSFTAHATDTRRDKFLCLGGIAALALFAADLLARGVDSLYGQFFVWLVAVAS